MEQQTLNSTPRDNNSLYESPIDVRPVVDDDTESDNTTPNSPIGGDGPPNSKYHLFSNSPSEMGSEKEEEQENKEVAVKAEEGRKEEADEIIRACEANYDAMERDGTLRRLNRMSRHHKFNEMGESIDKDDDQNANPQEDSDSESESSQQSSDVYVEDDTDAPNRFNNVSSSLP